MRFLSFVALCAVVAFCTGSELDNTYLSPNSAQTVSGNGAFLATPYYRNNQGIGFAGNGPTGVGSQGSFRNSQGYNQGENAGRSGLARSGSQGYNRGGNNGQSGFGGSAGFSNAQGYNQGGQGGRSFSENGGNQGGLSQTHIFQTELGFGGAQGDQSGAGFGQGGSSGNGYSSSNGYQQGGNGGTSGPSGSQGSYNQGGHAGTSGAYSQGDVQSQGQDIPILTYNNEKNSDGSYNFNYEAGNGIKAGESGYLQGDAVVARGGFAFVAPDGDDYSVSYTADENGFRAQGAHLPTPPPIPEAILKSIEQNARDATNPNRQHSSNGDSSSYSQEDHFSFGPSGSAAYSYSGSGTVRGSSSSSKSSDNNGYHY